MPNLPSQKLILLLCLLITASLAAWGLQSGVSGDWSWTMPGPDGNPVNATMTLVAEGEKLTGSIAFGENRKLQIEEGSIDGNKLKFTIKRERPSGGTMVYRMNGTVDGDSMNGTAATDMEGTPVSLEWKAKRKQP